MCTVTALPRSVLAQDPSSDHLVLRIVCNRDELSSRPPALRRCSSSRGAPARSVGGP